MKKSILHLTYDMRIGGTEQVIKNLIEGHDRNLFNMSILCIEAPIGPFGKILIQQGITIDTIPRHDGFDISLIFKIRTYIKKHRIDILHCHQYSPWVYGLLAAFLTKSNVIFTEHGRFYPDRSSWKRKLINPVFARMTGAITAISKATKQALVDYEAIPSKKIEVIYNGTAGLKPDLSNMLALKNSLSIAENFLVLGTIARLDPIKNHQLMLKAFKQVVEKYPNTILLIIGDGEERHNLENLVPNLGLTEKVIFTGYKSNPENYLMLMDIYLLSSLSEGTSMTLLEAMSLSKPCVVTDAGGNPEIIQDGVNGIVTPNDDTDAFAGAILKLVKHEDLRSRMAEASYVLFKERFSSEIMIKNYITHYN